MGIEAVTTTNTPALRRIRPKTQLENLKQLERAQTIAYLPPRQPPYWMWDAEVD